MSQHDPSRSQNSGESSATGGAGLGGASAGTSEFPGRGPDAPKPMADLGARSVEAYALSAKVAGRVVESVTREVTDYGRKAAEDALALAKSFAEIKSPDDLLRVQSQFAKTAFDNAMAFSSNVTGALKQTADEAAAIKRD